MGILANHVPSIEQLRPGLLEVIEDANNTKKYFGKGEEGSMRSILLSKRLCSQWWIRSCAAWVFIECERGGSESA